MPITAGNGQTYSDDQIKSFFSSNPDPSAIASQASSLGLNADQIAQASKIAGVNGGQGYSSSDISGTAAGLGYNFSGANGGIINGNPVGSATKAATAAANGSGTTAPVTATSDPNSTAANAATATANPGGMYIQGTYYTPKQITDFIANGGDPNQFAQQHGITDLWQIHDLAGQARQIAGAANPTGDAALQNYFKMYQQNSPNGANANDYQGWLRNQNTDVLNAIRSGTYSGAAVSGADYAPGGIYGPGSSIYGKAGYASGLGSNGDGSINNRWATSTGALGAATGAAGTTGTGIINGGTGTAGTTGGVTNGGVSTAIQSGSGGGTVPWAVTPDQTVEGRINGIINGNSGIIQQARTGALESMNDRGLMNSSIAQTAGDSAVYQAAIPIAQADAATAAKAAGYNADIQNQFTTNQLNRDTSMAQATLSADTTKSVAQLNSDTQKTIASLNNAEQLQAQQFSLNNATLLNTNSQAAQAYNTAMSAINNIQNNAQMNADAKTQAIANVWRSVQMQIQTIGNISGVNVNSQASFKNMPGFDENGNWVGFPTTTTAPQIAPAAPTETTKTRDF